MIRLNVLGTFEFDAPAADRAVVGLRQPRRLALLLYLALAEPPGPHSRDTLLALLWPEADQESARHSLRNALYDLRAALGDDAIVARGESYVGLAAGAIRCDATEFRRLAAEGRYEDAMAAWNGELAPGFHVRGAPEFERWLDAQRAALRREAIAVAWRRVDQLEPGGVDAAAAAARRAWQLDRTDEAGARRLMLLLGRSAGHAAALRVHDELAEVLAQDCGTGPSSDTAALAADIRANAPPPRAAPDRTGSAAVPPTAEPPHQTTTVRGRWPRVAVPSVLGGSVAVVAVVAVLAAAAARARAADGVPPDAIAHASADSLFRLAPRWRRDTAAYTSYLRGVSLRHAGHRAASRDTFASLVSRHPLFAPGFSGLAHAHALATINGEIPVADGWPRVEAAAHRALALDSASTSALLALGASEMFWRWNLDAARRLVDRGLALEPADPEAHAILGSWFRWSGDIDSALAEARAAATLDPLNPLWRWRLAQHLYLARRYDEAAQAYRRVRHDDPARADAAAERLVEVYHAAGRVADARDAVRLVGGVDPADWLAQRAHAQVRTLTPTAAGDGDRARRLAAAHAAIGNSAEALRWLDSAAAWRDPGLLTVPYDPVFDGVRALPEYAAWESRLPWRNVRR